MSDNSFAKFVPGFDFLQGLVKNASSALPGMGQWVAPTLNPEELGKRIDELRTVQYWLEQNARMLATTIQALEVQRMTLSTLQTMNVPLADLRDSLKLPVVAPEPAPAPAPAFAPKTSAGRTTRPRTKAAEVPPLPVDPTQWWSALSQQFTQLAANAMKDTATDAAKNLASAIVKQSFDAAGDTLRKAASVPGAMVGGVARGLGGAAPAATAKAAKATKPSATPSTKAPAKPRARTTKAAPRRAGG
ncbi:MAG: hypothetical protein DI603_07450 [Roseateles depolymerans]|uniref:Uncharacterized protein n=1 Tax=Roseateles depolymerans TaxID=76731 RepID=A0A2W5FLZ5_9BURK|nr:MAG: hypothetical protein DI603_07450 [Roseateles depolymerans]